jgi:hypothetical protein
MSNELGNMNSEDALSNFGKGLGGLTVKEITAVPSEMGGEFEIQNVVKASDFLDKENGVEKTAAAQSPEPTPDPVAASVDFDSLFKEKVGGKSFDEYSAYVKELEAKASAQKFEDKFNPDDINRLEAILQNGLDVNALKKIVDVQTMNLESLSAKDALARKLALVDGMDADEIKYELSLFDSGYDADELDSLSEQEKIKMKGMQARLEREGRKAKEELNKLKETHKLPEYKKVDQEALEQQRQLQLQEFTNQWKSAVDNSLQDYKEEVFDLGKGKKFSFAVNDESKRKAAESMNDVVNFHKRYETDGGKGYDWNKFRREQFILNNLDEVMKAVSQQVSSESAEKVVKEIKNVDFSSSPAQANAGKARPSINEQLAAMSRSSH